MSVSRIFNPALESWLGSLWLDAWQHDGVI